MKFCNICESMLYLKQENDENKLTYYCKFCDTEDDKPVDSEIYTQIYNDEFKCNTLIDNKYIKHDVTLPRVKNIDCINKECISKKKNIIKLTNLDDNELSKEQINNIVINLLELTEYPEKNYKLLDINLNEYYLEFNINSDYKIIFDKITQDDILHIENINITKIENEIIYIKYDNTNLKYNYICCNCLSNWTNK